MPPQRLSEKVQLKKKMTKIQNYNFDQTRNVCLINHLEVSLRKIKSCCNKNSDEESTFNIHITRTQDKAKGVNWKKLAKKFKFWNFSQNLTRDTPLEVGYEMDMASILEDTQRTRFCPKQARWNEYTPFNFVEWAV